MSCEVVASSHGILSCRGVFVDTLAIQPPATFRYIPEHGDGKAVTPDITCFSSFGTSRSVRAKKTGEVEKEAIRGKAKGYDCGNHAALYYKKSGSFFSILIVRCDTWAVQWGVENFDNGHEIKEMHALSAHTVVGTITGDANKKRLFVASRLHTQLARKQDNRLWRHFMAKPRLVELKGLDGNIVALIPTGPSSLAVLTSAGSLVLATIHVTTGAAEGNDDLITQQLVLPKGFRGVTPTSIITASCTTTEDEERHAFAVYTRKQNSVEVAIFAGPLGDTTGAVHRVSIAPKHSVNHAEFCGPLQLCMFLEGVVSKMVVQFATVDFDNLAVSASEALSVPYTPVASTFNARKSTQTLVCRVSRRGDAGIDSLVHTTLPLAQGPYTQNAVAKAVWQPLHDPYRHYDARTSIEKSEASELFRDLQMLGDQSSVAGVSGTKGVWVPLELFYCLASKEDARSAGKCDVAVFSVKTAPFLHTRLIKQWHNATNGLKQVLQSREQPSHSVSPLTRAWHPRHLRRALRLMNQDELADTFRNAVAAMHTSAYAETATSAVDTALQIVSLARQTGSVLAPHDVETVAVLLRASRSMGHESLRHGSRMGLLLESVMQQRRMNRLLRQRSNTTGEGEDAGKNDEAVDAQSLAKDFFGLPPEFHTMRALQTRYTANTWAQPLRENMAYHKSIAAQADRYMKDTASSLTATGVVVPDRASTWVDTGKRSHGDSACELFESTLMAANASK